MLKKNRSHRNYNYLDCLKKANEWLGILMGILGLVCTIKAIFEKDTETSRYYSIRGTLLLILFTVMTKNQKCECKCVCNANKCEE